MRKIPTKMMMTPDTFLTVAVFACSFFSRVPLEKPTKTEMAIMSKAITSEYTIKATIVDVKPPTPKANTDKATRMGPPQPIPMRL